MFSYKSYQMTENAVIDEIQKYGMQIFALQAQNNYDQNQNLSLSLSRSHSQQSIANDESEHQYPDENQASQMNIGRHILSGGMTNSNILSNYNRSEANRVQPINLKMIKNHNKNTLTERIDTHKKKRNRYAQNYISPYNKKQVNSTARSYMSKSYINPSKESNHMKYIKKKINQQIQPQISYKKQQNHINRQKNQKLLNVSSKYRQPKALMQGYTQYMNEHIYKKERNQMNYLIELQKRGQYRTKQQRQNSWNAFLQKQKQFKENKKQRVRQKQVQLIEQEQQFLQHHRKKAQQMKLKKQRMGLTVEQHIRKLKRQKEKMKERLYVGQISNFMTKSFQDKKFESINKNPFKSIFGVSIQQNFSTIRQDSSHSLNQMSELQNRIRNTILKQQAQLNRSKNKKQQKQSDSLTRIMKKKQKQIKDFSNQKIFSKQNKNKNKNVSQLLNPKYFKSINQLQQYSTSRSRQKNSFQERQKFLNYRNKLQERNSRLYGFDPKIMQASIDFIKQNQQLYRQKEESMTQRKYDLSSYRNISNLNPSVHKKQMQRKLKDSSTQSKIKHLQERFKKYKPNSYQNQKDITKNSLIIKKPGSFSYQPLVSPINDSSLIKVNANDMNFLFDSSN